MPNPSKPFELGLVMAGAVSAGAYTAGVLDFLFQALEEWQKEKDSKNPAVPDHALRVSVAAGASAGGIATALSALSAFTWPGPLDIATLPYGAAPPAQAANHALYRSWVSAIDIVPLLGTRDLQAKDAKLVSLLDGTPLREIAEAAANQAAAAIKAGGTSRFAWMGNPLQLILTVSNLRGVPYLLPLQAADSLRGHRMVNHADYAHFAVFGTGPGVPDLAPEGTTPLNKVGAVDFSRLVDAALATSAFPVGLPPRRFSNPLSLYKNRRWPVPGAPQGTLLAPDLSAAAPDPWSFPAVDGGALYNEPVGLARQAMLPGGAMATAGAAASRAILMIDPFPEGEDAADPADPGDPDLIGVALGVLNVLKNQARFHPDDVAAALSDTDFSRFLIAPSREKSAAGQTAMASAGLGGFAGFLHEDFRRHDFQLGRHNCQKFLRDHLALPVANPLVADWIARSGGMGGAVGDFHPKVLRDGVFEPDRGFIQLIPLVGSAVDPVGLLPWPRQGEAVLGKRLAGPLKARARGVADALAKKILGEQVPDPGTGTIDIGPGLLANAFAGWIRNLAEKSIFGDLKARDLLR